MATKTPVQKERDERVAREQDEQEQAQLSEVHTYPDGSQRVGVPPFPEESPLEEEARLGAAADQGPGVRGMYIPPGMKTSGATPPPSGGNTTEEEFRAKAEQQLTSDLMSGKSPNVANPTTSSDKPELANATADTSSQDVVMSADPTPEELEAIAASIEPKGNIEATDEEKLAAVQQVARETMGPVVANEKPAGKSKK